MNYKMNDVLQLIAYRLKKIPKFHRNRVQKELFNELIEINKRTSFAEKKRFIDSFFDELSEI